MNESIKINHLICGGKPVIRGTRIMVKNILGMIAGGYTLEKIVSVPGTDHGCYSWRSSCF